MTPPSSVAVDAEEPKSPVRTVAYQESSHRTDDESSSPIFKPVIVAPVENIDGRDAQQSSSGISLGELEAMALASHPAIRRQRSLIQAQRGDWQQAGLPFNPVAQYQSEEIGNESASGLHSLQLSQKWVTANKLTLAQNVQAAEVSRQQAEALVAELQILTEVRSAFATALVAQERVRQTSELLIVAKQSVESVEKMLEAQEVSRIALLQAQTALDQVQLAAENADTRLSMARRRLTAAVGTDSLRIEHLAGQLPTDLPEEPWSLLLSEITATSPELARAGSDLDRARRSLQLACAQVVPNVTTQLGVGYDGGTDNTFAMVGVSVPIPIWNRNEGNINRARAEISAASNNIQRLQLDLEQRLADATGRYRIARQRVHKLQESIIPRAEKTLEFSRQAFTAGETSFLELLTVQRTLSQTRLSRLDAIEQAQTAASEIDGMLVSLSN
ncbi:TolC family protein [Thalassoglobus neptunius]|nr:TolC family protein [Thalassoglobus neptunius]